MKNNIVKNEVKSLFAKIKTFEKIDCIMYFNDFIVHKLII